MAFDELKRGPDAVQEAAEVKTNKEGGESKRLELQEKLALLQAELTQALDEAKSGANMDTQGQADLEALAMDADMAKTNLEIISAEFATVSQELSLLESTNPGGAENRDVETTGESGQLDQGALAQWSNRSGDRTQADDAFDKKRDELVKRYREMPTDQLTQEIQRLSQEMRVLEKDAQAAHETPTEVSQEIWKRVTTILGLDASKPLYQQQRNLIDQLNARSSDETQTLQVLRIGEKRLTELLIQTLPLFKKVDAYQDRLGELNLALSHATATGMEKTRDSETLGIPSDWKQGMYRDSFVPPIDHADGFTLLLEDALQSAGRENLSLDVFLNKKSKEFQTAVKTDAAINSPESPSIYAAQMIEKMGKIGFKEFFDKIDFTDAIQKAIISKRDRSDGRGLRELSGLIKAAQVAGKAESFRAIINTEVPKDDPFRGFVDKQMNDAFNTSAET